MSSDVRSSSGHSRFRQAYDRHFEAICAVEKSRFLRMTVDVAAVYVEAGAALLRVRPFRDEVLSIPCVDSGSIENVDDYLLALGHAQTLYLTAMTPVSAVPELYARLIDTREQLLADGHALAARGLLSGDTLDKLDGPTSHVSTAFDVLALGALFRLHWDAIANKTALKMSEIERAEGQADQLLLTVRDRAASTEEVYSASLNRKRAFALFGHAYEEMRRGVSVIRWYDRDLDKLIPSLYAKRSRPRTRSPGPSDRSTSAV